MLREFRFDSSPEKNVDDVALEQPTYGSQERSFEGVLITATVALLQMESDPLLLGAVDLAVEKIPDSQDYLVAGDAGMRVVRHALRHERTPPRTTG